MTLAAVEQEEVPEILQPLLLQAFRSALVSLPLAERHCLQPFELPLPQLKHNAARAGVLIRTSANRATTPSAKPMQRFMSNLQSEWVSSDLILLDSWRDDKR